MAALKVHYLTHFPLKSGGPNPVIHCIFKKSCSNWWTERKRVQSCFNNHKSLSAPSVISFFCPSSSVDASVDVLQSDGENSEGDVDVGDVDVGDVASEAENQTAGDNTQTHVFQETGETSEPVQMVETLADMYGTLRYIYRVQQDALNVVAKNLKTMGEILNRQIHSVVEEVFKKKNLEDNNDFMYEVKNEINQIMEDPFFNKKYASNYRRNQTFVETEDIIQPIEWQIDKDIAPKDTVVVFDIVKQMQRFLQGKGIQQIWEHSKESRERNNIFNENCLLRGEPQNQRYHTIYDGRRIKEVGGFRKYHPNL